MNEFTASMIATVYASEYDTHELEVKPMAFAFVGYSFGFVEPGATVGIYLHGFPKDQFAAIDVRPLYSPARPFAFFPSIDVDAHTVSLHVDDTLAHTIFVTNKSTSNGAPPTPIVDVVVLLEPLQ